MELKTADYRATKEILLREDATDVVLQKLGNDTHIGYHSESHPHKYCVQIIEGYWVKKSIDKHIIILIEE